MKILFVYPLYPETFWSFKHALRFLGKKAAFPPLGLLTVAAMLPERWEKKLVDLNVSGLDDRQIDWADIVFVSAMLVQAPSAREVIQRCKARGKTVVAGGPAFTARHEQFEGVDHFVLNEAEVTLPQFLDDLEHGRPQPVYTTDEHPDLSETPIPLWSLIRLKDYAVVPVQYSRGCPFNCEFCDIIVMYGRKPRTKTPEQLIREIQALYDAGWRSGVFIVDDNFIGNKRNVKQMLPHLIRWQREHNVPFNLLTEASADLADDEQLMRMMAQANFRKVFLGIETPDPDGLRECGKHQNASRDMTEVVATIHRHGMQVMGGFIVGFDTDNESIFQRQINFIQNTGIVTAMVGMLNALPHTALWHRLNAEGRLRGDTTGENTEARLNFLPRMPEQALLDGYKRILTTIYSPRQYYQRIYTLLRSCNPEHGEPTTPEGWLAFVRSMWEIGVRSKARLLYWKLLVKTLLTRRKAFPLAVELAIYGLHFERVTARIVGGVLPGSDDQPLPA